MWELIRANRRKSWILFISMGICLILLGYLIGSYISPGAGGIGGIIIASVVWMVMSLISMSSGSSILLTMSKAKEVTPDVHPQLFNVVEEMKIAANLPAMPKIYIINTPAMNAFATGKGPKKSAVAVTAGMLSKLNRDELQGVMAHEVSHIMNRDVQFMTFAGILLGSIVLISQVFLRGMLFSGGGRRYSSDSKGGGQAQLIIMVVAIVFAILAPIMAQLLYFAISRKREYLADASAARITRYPEGLASALEKLSNSTEDLETANKVTAPMYIVNPLKAKGKKVANLTSTHPPISERVKILRNMMHGHNAGYSNYQQAYAEVRGKSSGIFPGSALTDKEVVNIRGAAEGTAAGRGIKAETRATGDIMMAVNHYRFSRCDCGLKFKIPENFRKKEITCPKCGKVNAV